MSRTWTNDDFDALSWHDCEIWGIEFHNGEPIKDDWRADLVFNIDFITEWLCLENQRCRFQVALARLVFHDVSDLRIDLNWDHPECKIFPNTIDISQISREPIADTNAFSTRTEFRWCIECNVPIGGEITFRASGFTQTLRTDPVSRDSQSFSHTERLALLTANA